MTAVRTWSRRYVTLMAMMAAMVMLLPGIAAASPLHLNVQPTERSNDIKVKIYTSVHLGPANINNHYLGTWYVPKSGSTKTVNLNVMSIVFMVLKMSYEEQKKDLKIWSQAAAGMHKTTMTVIKNIK